MKVNIGFNFEFSTEESSTEIENRQKTLPTKCNAESNFQIVKLFFCILSIFGLIFIFQKNLMVSFVKTIVHILKAIFTKKLLS